MKKKLSIKEEERFIRFADKHYAKFIEYILNNKLLYQSEAEFLARGRHDEIMLYLSKRAICFENIPLLFNRNNHAEIMMLAQHPLCEDLMGAIIKRDNHDEIMFMNVQPYDLFVERYFDEGFLAIIARNNPAELLWLSQIAWTTAKVKMALINTGNHDVIMSLLLVGGKLSEENMLAIVAREEDDEIARLITKQKRLPALVQVAIVNRAKDDELLLLFETHEMNLSLEALEAYMQLGRTNLTEQLLLKRYKKVLDGKVKTKEDWLKLVAKNL